MLWFDIFMAIVMMLIPCTMLFFGRYWTKHPPDRINCAYGYRSRRSMYNQATWRFAHKIAAAAWRRLGYGTLAATLILILFLLHGNLSVTFSGILGGATVLVQLIPMLAVIPITERALKKHFSI